MCKFSVDLLDCWMALALAGMRPIIIIKYVDGLVIDL